MFGLSGFSGSYLFGGVFMMIFWILIVFAIIYFLMKYSSGEKSSCCGGHNASEKKSTDSLALKILEERYAKGEIDKKEFDEKKKDLTN